MKSNLIIYTQSADPNLLNDDEDISGNPDDLEEHEDMIEVKV